MACYNSDTIFFAVNSTFDALTDTTGKCNASTCAAAYCRLAARTDADWVCFSGGASNVTTVADEGPRSLWLLYTCFTLLVVYAIVASLLFGRLYYQKVHQPYVALKSMTSQAMPTSSDYEMDEDAGKTQ